jgi:tripartite-type tricarboxylate transporter receptor subunit TctC
MEVNRSVPVNTVPEFIAYAALADPALKARLVALGADPMVMGPAEFGKLIVDETEKWAKVIKFAGIKAE